MASETASRPGKVFFVEDDRDSREAFASLLRMSGFEVSEFETAEDALAAMDSDRPAFVVMDITLPGIDGYEAAGRVRALPSGSGVRLVALTGHTRGKVQAQSALFDAILIKPVDPDALIAVLVGFREAEAAASRL